MASSDDVEEIAWRNNPKNSRCVKVVNRSIPSIILNSPCVKPSETGGNSLAKLSRFDIFFGGYTTIPRTLTSLVLSNKSMNEELNVELTIEGSQSFRITGEDGKTSIQSLELTLNPKEHKKIYLRFLPKALLGPQVAKFRVRPILDGDFGYEASEVALSGYGGCGNILISIKQIPIKLFNSYIISLDNAGQVDAYATIQVLRDDGVYMDPTIPIHRSSSVRREKKPVKSSPILH